MAIKYLVAAFTMAVLASPLQAQLIDPTGYRYDLVGTLRVDAKLKNCTPLKHAPKKKITIRNQLGNSKLSLSFIDNYNVTISNDDAGKGLNDQGNKYLPQNYTVNGSIFSRKGNNLKISRRSDSINYNQGAESLLAIYNADEASYDFFGVHNYEDGAQSILPIYNRQLRWKVRSALESYMPDDSVSKVDSEILMLLNHVYTPKKFSMDMQLKKGRTATLKEVVVAETTFAVPSNPYLPAGTCTIQITSKRSVKTPPDQFAYEL